MKTSELPNEKSPRMYDHTTAMFAARIANAPGSVRKNYCLQGHHLGAKPLKLENGRLMWCVDDVTAILTTGSAK